MCKYFSFVSDGEGNFHYFNEDHRASFLKGNPHSYKTDSHASICAFFGLNEDHINKYEYDPYRGKFTVDQINAKNDDRVRAENWVRNLKIPTNFISGYLDVSGCDLSKFKLPDYIDGNLYVNGCDLSNVKLPDHIRGYLNVRGCDLSNAKLPGHIGGDLDVSGCDLTNVKLPDYIGGYLDVCNCNLSQIAKWPDQIDGALYCDSPTEIPKHLRDKI